MASAITHLVVGGALSGGAPARLRTAVLGLALLAAPGPSAGAAKLVVLVGGDVLRVERVTLLEEEKVRLELPAGGGLTLSLLRVERILEAEVSDEEPPVAPSFELAFRDQALPQVPFRDLIYQVSREHQVNPRLVAAVIRAESAFAPDALSYKGARGLMQLMPATAVRFGVAPEELFDPARNLEAGVAYLDWLSRRFAAELPLVLAAYNAGEGAVDRHQGVPPYRETVEYIGRVYDLLGLPAPAGS